jgi:AcrR family transcriptional regulator
MSQMQEIPVETGRVAQRRRTRKAIIQATMDMIAQGQTPNIADVARAADVSRRTIYMYFPTLDQLLVDATLGALSEATVESVFAPSEQDEDVEARVDLLVKTLLRQLDDETERLGRTLIRLTVETPGDQLPPASPRRGYRRVEWIERAIAPLRPQLDPPRFERLISALALVTGWEAMLVLRDIRNLDRTQEEDVATWAARALVRAALNDVAQAAQQSGMDLACT